MKSFLYLIFGFATIVKAEDRYPQQPLYEIVSNELDSTLKEGTVKVSGQVFDENGFPLVGAIIANFERTVTTGTNTNGEFRIILSDKSEGVFMYDSKYGEILVRGNHFISRHNLIVNFYPRNKSEEPIMVRKPVIYFYGDSKTEFAIKVNHSNIFFTYPKMNEGWQFTADENGIITLTASQKKYPYLFWEAQSEKLNYTIDNFVVEGFLLKSDTLVSFFENQLDRVGFNGREKTDFITYWAPQMIEKEFVFIQFILNEKYDEKIATLEMAKKPDTMMRFFMLFTLLDQPGDFPFVVKTPQDYETFKREGNCLVEWGGAEIQSERVRLAQ